MLQLYLWGFLQHSWWCGRNLLLFIQQACSSFESTPTMAAGTFVGCVLFYFFYFLLHNVTVSSKETSTRNAGYLCVWRAEQPAIVWLSESVPRSRHRRVEIVKHFEEFLSRVNKWCINGLLDIFIFSSLLLLFVIIASFFFFFSFLFFVSFNLFFLSCFCINEFDKSDTSGRLPSIDATIH